MSGDRIGRVSDEVANLKAQIADLEVRLRVEMEHYRSLATFMETGTACSGFEDGGIAIQGIFRFIIIDPHFVHVGWPAKIAEDQSVRLVQLRLKAEHFVYTHADDKYTYTNGNSRFNGAEVKITSTVDYAIPSAPAVTHTFTFKPHQDNNYTFEVYGRDDGLLVLTEEILPARLSLFTSILEDPSKVAPHPFDD